MGVGLVRAGAEVEMSFAATQVSAGVFAPEEKNTAILIKQLDELTKLAEALKPLR